MEGYDCDCETEPRAMRVLRTFLALLVGDGPVLIGMKSTDCRTGPPRRQIIVAKMTGPHSLLSAAATRHHSQESSSALCRLPLEIGLADLLRVRRRIAWPPIYRHRGHWLHPGLRWDSDIRGVI
jgi:hypothetical protein